MKKEISKLGRIIVILFLAVSMTGMFSVAAVNSVKAQQYFKISGYVFANVGTPVEGVEITGLPGDPVTNSNGYYETYVMEHESYVGKPVKQGYEFSPKEWRYSDVTSDQAKNFWDIKLYTISGYVKDEAGKGLKNIKLNGLPATTVTDANGFYSCVVGSGWSGTVTPEVELRTFEPTKRTYANVLADQPNQDYKAKYAEYSISGYVRTKEGKGVPGVVVKGVLSERSTDWRGFYKVAVGADWVGSLAPQKAGYIFIPPSKSYDMGIILDTLIEENFTARPATDTDCSKVTVQSVQSGNWNDPTVWSPAGVPRQTDRVKINEWDTVTVTASGTISLTSLCNYGKLTISKPVDLQIAATDFIYNSGSMIGANGVVAAQAGSSVMLAATKIVYNTGTIQGGNGANDGNFYAQGGSGGSVGIYGEKIFNEGKIIGGNGGSGHSYWPGGSGTGGDGGDTVLLSTSVLMNRPSAVISTGQGGSGWAVPYVSCRSKHRFGPFRWGHVCDSYGGWYASGASGDLTYSASTSVQNGTLRGRTVTLDPSTFEMTENTARIEAEEDIIISGGQGTTVYLADLVDGAITAGGKITIMLGPGSTLDMRGLTAGSIQAKEAVEIFADNIVTDEGVTIEQLIIAPEITQNPGKEPHEVVLTGTGRIVEKAGALVKVNFTVINHSAKSDTFTISVSDTKGWQRSAVSSSVSLDALGKQDFSFDVTLPSEAGAEDVITITAGSVAYPETTATLEVKVSVEMILTEDDVTDEDKDGLPKFQEVKLGTEPANKDTDGDGMDDGWEVNYKLNPIANDAGDDKDSDEYSNLQEYETGSDPTVADSDGDGVNDGSDNCVDVKNSDQADSDGDGTGNACEMSEADGDNDGMPDEWETEYGLDTSSNDSEQDKDGDKWSNISEFQKMTDPSNAADYPKTPSDIDRDGDKVADTEDVFPDNPNEWLDSDKDGVGDNADLDDDNDQMLDVYEVQYNLNPFNDADAMEDPDNDRYVNLQEFGAGTDPHNPASKPGTNPVNPNPDNSITISGSGGYKMFVTPISTNEPGPMRVTQEADGSFKGTNGSTNVVVISDPTAIGDSYTFTTGKNLTGTGVMSELIVKPNSDGTNTYKVPDSPEVAVTVKADGSYTATDEENPGAVFSGKSDGSFTVTDEESPGSIFAVDADGKKTVTDAEFTGMQAVINNDGTNTVTDTESPGMQAVANKNGTLTVTDAEFPGTVVVYNPADDSYSVTDPEFPGRTIAFKADGTYTVTDADGKCYDITQKRGWFKKLINKVASVVNKVAGFVKKAANFVKKVATFVAKVANIVKKVAGVVSKVFGCIATCLGPCNPFGAFAACVAAVSNTVGIYAGIVETVATKVADTAGKVAGVAEKVENASKDVMDSTQQQATQQQACRSRRDETPPPVPDCEAVTLYTASGIVKDSAGNPLADVKVQIDDSVTTTDNTGAWKIIGLESEAYTATASKAGYVFTSAAFAIADENVTVSISEKQENPILDKDSDGVVDSEDAFPDDPNESADADKDGIGNNADSDDDNDGMPDAWETQYGLNPLVNDAAEDKDGDKYSNLQEYEADTKPNDADSKPVDKEEVNLITNGSFEFGTDPGEFSNLQSGSTDIEGWEVVSGDVDYAGSGWKASDGYRSIDMAGFGAGSISQSFPTEIGRKYEVLFDMAGNGGGQPTIKNVKVVAGLTSREFAFDVTGYNAATMGWTEKSFIFSATEEISVLTFIELVETCYGAAIDNVRVFETDKPDDPNDPPVEGRILNPQNAHYYKLIDTPMAWNDAKNYCESLGGYLATITSENEHTFVYNNFQGNENCWLGGTDQDEERNWKWITGEAWEYTGWASGEPNNSCVDTCEENYIEIYLTGGASPGWNDIPGSWPHKSICEWGSTTNFKAGVFTVGSKGIIEIDWLYDGGMYKGELGIFSLKGMEKLTPGSSEFIAEAVRRVLSDSTEGHLVLSDPTEAAHFSGLLGGEPTDWNNGEYTGVKSFEMEPGDFFATILVPDSTFTALAANPGTGDSHKRPLFSLVSSNPAYGMYLGQIADVNGKGMAYAYEDMNAATSDKDYNDLIIQISGAAIDEAPSLNDMTGSPKRSRARDNSGWFDWRTETELGRVIMEHLDAQVVSPETVWLSADVNFPADITVYAPDEESFGTKGGHIPGATFGTDIDGYRFVKLPSLENGDYRILLMSASGQSGLLTLRKHQGDDILSESGETVTVEAHGTVKAEISVSDSGNESGIAISTAEQGIRYDFNGDGVIDDSDIEVVSEIWNTCKGDEKYDPFFDLDNDGCITVKDIMAVVGR